MKHHFFFLLLSFRNKAKLSIMKIAIIGAGGSGLTAIKSCIEEDLLPVCFESSSDFGGLWRYHEEDVEGRASVMRNTTINTGKERTAFSDFPPDKLDPNYMHHSRVLKYFQRYADHFDLQKYIRFNTEVVKVERLKSSDETVGHWRISTRCAQTDTVSEEVFDAVMVCTGHHVYPHFPIFPNQHVFKGIIMHSHALKSSEGFKGKRIAVIGMGNSALDAAVDATYSAEQVYLSTRRGAWVISRVGANGYPFDLRRTRFNSYLDSWRSFDSLCDKYEKMTNSAFDHTLYGIKPKHRIFSVHGTLNDAFPSVILSGRVEIKSDVERFEEDGIVFVGEREATNVDVVILATGYQIKFPFLDSSVFSAENNKVHLYKYVLSPREEHRTLAFIGLVQPLGSIMPISEMQSRWFVQLLIGNLKLPSTKEMEADILKKKEALAKRYIDAIRHTIQVDYMPYMDELAEMIGVKPNFWSLALKDPELCWTCINGPVTAYQFRLVGPHTWSGARYAILSYKERVYAPLNPNLCKQNKKPFVLLPKIMFYAIIAAAFIVISMKLCNELS